MKKTNIFLVSLISIFTFTGCGDNKSPFDYSSNLGRNIRMEKNKPYEVKKGDQIEKISENPELRIEANLTSGMTTVTLINGEASIIKK